MRKPIKRDVEAIKWAVSLLEIHPGVQANENSQYWLMRLRAMLPPPRPLTLKETQAILGASDPVKVQNLYEALQLYMSHKHGSKSGEGE